MRHRETGCLGPREWISVCAPNAVSASAESALNLKDALSYMTTFAQLRDAAFPVNLTLPLIALFAPPNALEIP